MRTVGIQVIRAIAGLPPGLERARAPAIIAAPSSFC